MLKIFLEASDNPNIFEDFVFMDKREKELRKTRETPQFHD